MDRIGRIFEAFRCGPEAWRRQGSFVSDSPEFSGRSAKDPVHPSKSPDALGGENCAASSAGRRGLTPGYGEDRWNTSMGTSTRKPMWGRFDSDLGVGLSSLSCGPAGCGPLGRGGTELKVFRVFREWHLSFQQLFSCGSTPTSVLRQSRSPGGVRMPQFEGTTDSRPWRSSPGG